jgi:hypothetical protein
MHLYVRWYWPDEDLWNYEELDAENWSLRHVEMCGSSSEPVAAASLAQTLAARNAGGADAVHLYERRYGVIPEAPFPSPESEPALQQISAAEFEQQWQVARSHLEARPLR